MVVCWSQIEKTILLVILGILLMYITPSNYYLIFIIIGMIAFFDGCANPIIQTLIPYYVKPEHLIRANGMADTVTQVIQAVMWFVGRLFLIVMKFSATCLVSWMFIRHFKHLTVLFRKCTS